MVGVFLSHDTRLLLEVSWESLGLALRAAKGGGGVVFKTAGKESATNSPSALTGCSLGPHADATYSRATRLGVPLLYDVDVSDIDLFLVYRNRFFKGRR